MLFIIIIIVIIMMHLLALAAISARRVVWHHGLIPLALRVANKLCMKVSMIMCIFSWWMALAFLS